MIARRPRCIRGIRTPRKSASIPTVRITIKDLMGGKFAGRAANPGPLFQPHMTFGILLASAVIGIAEAIVEEYLAHSRKSIAIMSGKESGTFQADDLIKRGLRRPEFLIVDGAPGLEKVIAAVWDGVPVQRCTVHKHRSLLAHAPERLHEEIGADYRDMIYAATREDIEIRRKAFIRKWRLKTALSPTAWRRPSKVLHLHPSAAEPVAQRAQQMQSCGCTKSLSEGSTPRRCCRRQIPLPCCSWDPVRSTCAKSMAG